MRHLGRVGHQSVPMKLSLTKIGEYSHSWYFRFCYRNTTNGTTFCLPAPVHFGQLLSLLRYPSYQCWREWRYSRSFCVSCWALPYGAAYSLYSSCLTRIRLASRCLCWGSTLSLMCVALRAEHTVFLKTLHFTFWILKIDDCKTNTCNSFPA